MSTLTVQNINGLTGFTVGDVTYPNAGALSNRNRITNGAMVIDQRNGGAAVTYGAQTYITDRFSVEKYNLNTLVATAQQVSDAPADFRHSLKTTVTTAQTSGSDSFLVAANPRIEGYDFADFSFGTSGAQSFTLSFWVKASVTGTYCVSFFNSDVSRAYLATYSVSSANTWEYKTITVAGDTSGTWNTTNGIGLGIQFTVGGGSNQEGTAGSWSGTYKRVVSGSVDLNATLNATWQITGVQLEVGDTATPFEHEPFSATLQKCRRFYQNVLQRGNSTTGTYYSYYNTFHGNQVQFEPMRTSPTVSYTHTGGAFYWVNPGVTPYSANSTTSFSYTAQQHDDFSMGSIIFSQARQAGGTTPADFGSYRLEADIIFHLDAEL